MFFAPRSFVPWILHLDNKHFSRSADRAYTLRYVVAHVCLANDAKLLKDVLLDFRAWETIYKAGESFASALPHFACLPKRPA